MESLEVAIALLGIVEFPDSRHEPDLEAVHLLKSLPVNNFTKTCVPFIYSQ